MASFLWHVEHVSSEHYCHTEVFCSVNCGAIAVIIVEIFNECLTTPPLDDDIIDCDRESIIEWHQLLMETEARKLAVEGNRFCSRSIITTIRFPFLTWWLSSLVPISLSRPTITRHPISMHTDHCLPQLLCSKVFLCKLGGIQHSKAYVTLKHFYFKLPT